VIGRRGRIAAIGLAALAIAAAAGVYAVSRSAAPAVARYDTAPVQRGTLVARVTATGTLSPRVEVQVGSQVSGRIQELLADFNSPVQKGQVIARIDPRLFEAELAKARANEIAAHAAVARAEADLTDARLKNERAQGLAARGMGSRADADSALAAFQAARAQVDSAKASLAQTQAAREQTETNLGYTTIVSPIDGIVISRDVDVGQTVAATLQTPTLFTIAEDLRQMELHTNVAEADVGRLLAGMPVEFTVDAYPSRRFRGVVKEIRYAPQTVQNVVTYDAVVSVDNGDLALRPGMTADVSFLVAQHDDVLLVPNAALRFAPPPELAGRGEAALREATAAAAGRDVGPARDGESGSAAAGTERVLWVLGEDGSPRPMVVRIGIGDGRSTEVEGGGLAAGAAVIVGAKGGEAEASERPRFGRIL